MNAEQIIERACREVIAAFRLVRRIGRTVPISNAALALRLAAEEAERAEAAS